MEIEETKEYQKGFVKGFNFAMERIGKDAKNHIKFMKEYKKKLQTKEVQER